MSVETTREPERRESREIIPGPLREAVFAVGLVLGVAIFSVGYIQVILGLSVGFRGGNLLTAFQQTTMTVVGVGLFLRFFTVRLHLMEHYVDRDQPVPRLVESVVLAPLFVGLLVGFAAAIVTVTGTLITVSGPAAPVVYGLYALVLAAAANLVVEGLRMGGFRLIDAGYDALESVGVTPVRRTKAIPIMIRDSPTGVAALTVLVRVLLGGSPERTKTNVGVLGLFVGTFLILLGVAAQATVSAPFVATMSDKVFLLGFGLACVWFGGKVMRLAARVVGW